MFDHLVDYLRDPVPFGRESNDFAMDEGVHVQGRGTVRALLYADDVVLVARSHDGLLALLRRLRIFCTLSSAAGGERGENQAHGGGARAAGGRARAHPPVPVRGSAGVGHHLQVPGDRV